MTDYLGAEACPEKQHPVANRAHAEAWTYVSRLWMPALSCQAASHTAGGIRHARHHNAPGMQTAAKADVAAKLSVQTTDASALTQACALPCASGLPNTLWLGEVAHNVSPTTTWHVGINMIHHYGGTVLTRRAATCSVAPNRVTVANCPQEPHTLPGRHLE